MQKHTRKVISPCSVKAQTSVVWGAGGRVFLPFRPSSHYFGLFVVAGHSHSSAKVIVGRHFQWVKNMQEETSDLLGSLYLKYLWDPTLRWPVVLFCSIQSLSNWFICSPQLTFGSFGQLRNTIMFAKSGLTLHTQGAIERGLRAGKRISAFPVPLALRWRFHCG